MDHVFFWGTVIIAITITGVSIGRFPFLKMNRATIAFVGAVLLVTIGAISQEEAVSVIDLDTIALLLALMMLNANFRLSGFFSLITAFILRIAKTPGQLLGLIILFSGIFSALFLNDTIVLVFTPVILEITILLKRNPLPYLIALAASANVGSVATIIGNPQNIIIGASSGIPFVQFVFQMAPIAFIGLIIVWIVICFIYRKEFSSVELGPAISPSYVIHKPLLRKSILAACILVGALFAGVPTTLSALVSTSILLITRRLKPERVFAEVDWSLLIFFSGLFVVTKSVETIGLSKYMLGVSEIQSDSSIFNLTLISAVASNLISNVPAVLLLRPFIESNTGWYTLAMATTLAGNLTLLGSIANLIVAESAKKQGVHLSFFEYFKAGVPITIITILAGVIWLSYFGQY